MPAAAGTERTLRAILQYGIDPRGLREVQAGTTELEDGLNSLRQTTMELSEEWQDLGSVASQFEAIGMEFADMGTRITDSMKGWADQYVQVAGEADEVSQAWLSTTEELETAQARLGGVAIEALIPMVEATASMVDKAADLAEKYPEAMQVALGIGTAVVAAAALQSAVTRGIRLFADAKLLVIETQRLIAAKMMRDAANKQLAAAAAMGAASKERALLGMGGAGKAAGVGGALAAAAPALAIGAAVVAVGAAGVAVKRFADDVGSKTEEMAGHWDVFLSGATDEAENAADLASRYNDAQRGVNKAYDDGGVVASVFLNRQGLVNASQDKMQRALVQVSKDHADYTRAIGDLNANLGESERAFELLDKATFEHRRELAKLWQSYREGNATLRDLADASSNVQGALLGIAAMIQDAVSVTNLLEPWQEYQDELERATKEQADELARIDQESKAGQVKLDVDTADERERIVQEYNGAVLAMDLDTTTQREGILERQNDAVVDAEKEIGSDRVATMSSFLGDMALMEQEHYAARSEAAEDYSIEVQRAEQDHQISMRRMQEDSGKRQQGAIRARDAIALLEEVRSYQSDRGRAEEDYRIEAGRRSEDFGRQLAQMEVSFQEQRAAREQAYQEELAALQERLNEEKRIQDEQATQELEALDESRQRQIKDLHDQKEGEEQALDESYARQEYELASTLQKQRVQTNQAHSDALTDAQTQFDRERQMRGVYRAGELSELDAHYQARLSSLQAWMGQAALVVRPTSGGFPERQSGGYSAGKGLHMLGEQGREFVMDAPTTRRAETVAGGNLTQDRLLAAMSGGGGAQVQVTQTNHFGNVSDPARIGAMIEQRTLQVMERVLRDLR